MNVTIIIPTYNRAGLLNKNLSYLARFTEVKQIVIIDDNSTDKRKQELFYLSNSNAFLIITQDCTLQELKKTMPGMKKLF